MPHTPKIATCCYCGTRAALVVDQARHELACSSCGAPLHNLKSLRSEVAPAPKRAKYADRQEFAAPPKKKSKKKKKNKSLGRYAAGKVWDVLDDIFD